MTVVLATAIPLRAMMGFMLLGSPTMTALGLAVSLTRFKDGVSHNEIKDAQSGYLKAGCNVLLQAILEHAGVALA